VENSTPTGWTWTGAECRELAAAIWMFLVLCFAVRGDDDMQVLQD
jgi:hypothetical protein